MLKVEERIEVTYNPEREQSQEDIKELFGYSPRKIFSIYDMLYEFDLVSICNGMDLLKQMKDILDRRRDKRILEKFEIITVKSMLSQLAQTLSLLDIGNIRHKLRYLDEMLSTERLLCSRQAILEELIAVDTILRHEMEAAKYYQLSREEVKYVALDAINEKILNAFPDCIYDLQEAYKCYAFGRHTASAFHFIRVVETGLEALCKPLNIGYTPSWNSLLSNINDYIEKLDSRNDKAELDKLNPVLIQAIAIKNAWRNPTMHVERRYSGEEAKEVFDATENFMRNLCDVLDFYSPKSP